MSRKSKLRSMGSTEFKGAANEYGERLIYWGLASKLQVSMVQVSLTVADSIRALEAEEVIEGGD